VESKNCSELRLFVEAAPNGWWYRCPSRDGRQQIVFLSDADLVRDMARSARNWFAANALRTKLGKAVLVGEPERIVAADTYCRDAAIGDNIIMIGDAAMAGDPLGGQGVTWAVSSGVRAAEIALSNDDYRAAALAAYSENVLARFAEFLDSRSVTYGQVTRWPHSPFWLRRRYFRRV
jgi:flavin-dependent dehydrogenase